MKIRRMWWGSTVVLLVVHLLFSPSPVRCVDVGLVNTLLWISFPAHHWVVGLLARGTQSFFVALLGCMTWSQTLEAAFRLVEGISSLLNRHGFGFPTVGTGMGFAAEG